MSILLRRNFLRCMMVMAAGHCRYLLLATCTLGKDSQIIQETIYLYGSLLFRRTTGIRIIGLVHLKSWNQISETMRPFRGNCLVKTCQISQHRSRTKKSCTKKCVCSAFHSLLMLTRTECGRKELTKLRSLDCLSSMEASSLQIIRKYDIWIYSADLWHSGYLCADHIFKSTNLFGINKRIFNIPKHIFFYIWHTQYLWLITHVDSP